MNTKNKNNDEEIRQSFDDSNNIYSHLFDQVIIKKIVYKHVSNEFYFSFIESFEEDIVQMMILLIIRTKLCIQVTIPPMIAIMTMSNKILPL